VTPVTRRSRGLHCCSRGLHCCSRGLHCCSRGLHCCSRGLRPRRNALICSRGPRPSGNALTVRRTRLPSNQSQSLALLLVTPPPTRANFSTQQLIHLYDGTCIHGSISTLAHRSSRYKNLTKQTQLPKWQSPAQSASLARPRPVWSWIESEPRRTPVLKHSLA
jgi:hypothetical protein